MSDSLPPTGGSDSYDGWDLEGLLSGENVWLPEGMRPVAGTLASLRAAPMRAELVGEAAARAAFRQIMQSGRSGPAWTSGGADDARTLILPARTAAGGPRVATGPRHSHRRPRRRRRWQPKALLGGAVGAAIVIIGGIALAGAFPGVGGHPAQSGDSPGTSATARSGGAVPSSGGLEGSAKKEAPAVLAPTASASGGQPSSSGSGAESERSALCRQYWAFFAHPESHADWVAEQRALHKLSELAGSPWNVPRYCGDYDQWGFTPQGAVPDPGDDQGGPGTPSPSDQPGKSKSQSHADNGNGNSGNGNGKGGNGNGGNGKGGNGKGNGQGGNSSGSGNQQ